MNYPTLPASGNRKGRMLAASLLAVMAMFTASQAAADRYRTVVVHETVRSSPVTVVHGSSFFSSVVVAPVVYLSTQPSKVYYAPGHRSSYVGNSGHGVVTTTTRTTTTVRHQVYASPQYSRHYPSHYSQHHNVISHPGKRHGRYKHSQSRGSWSSNRRDVVHVNHRGNRNSNYRAAERTSAVIRDRRR